MSTAASNFEDGFDETTYDQPEIKPNRPVAGNYEMTPDSPGAESFGSFTSKEMDAPEDATDDTDIPAEAIIQDDSEVDDTEDVEETEEVEDTEETEEADEEVDSDDEEEKEEGNPEAGANPKKKVEESVFVKDFGQFVNEHFNIKDVVNALRQEEDTCPNCNELYRETRDGGIECGCKGHDDCGCDDTYSCGCNA
jgi:hypothetical protein